MSISTARYFRAIEKLTTATRDELKGFIDRSKLNIPKNIATIAMREALIKIIVDKYKAEVDKNRAAAAKYIASARKAADKRKYFVTYKLNLFDNATETHSSAWFSKISGSRIPDNDKILKEATAGIAAKDEFKPYKRDVLDVERVMLMSVPLRNKEQLNAFRAIAGLNTSFSDARDSFNGIIEQFKLQANLYRTIHRINGFPDNIDKGDGMCVPNFLEKDVGFAKSTIDKWFYNKKVAGLEGFVSMSDITYTAQDLYDFAVDHDRSCYLLDRRNFCFKHHNGKSKHGCIYAMIEDGHVYPIADEGARRTIREKLKAKKGSFVPSKDNKDSEAPVRVVKRFIEFDDIFTPLTYSLIPGVFVQTHANDLRRILDAFIDHDYIPDIRYANGSICSIRFDKTIVLHKPDYVECNITPFDSHEEIASHYYNEMVEENPDMLGSIYGKTAQAKVFVDENVSENTHLGLDFSKFYYNCARALTEKIPVFGVGSKQPCSKFTNDKAYYYVITDDISLFRGSDYYTCELIREAVKAGIPFEITHKLVPNTFIEPKLVQDKLKQIVELFDGDLNRAKKSLVRFIGLLARSVKSSTHSYLIPINEQDAGSVLYYYLDEKSRGRDVSVHVGAYPGVHMITSEKSTEIPMNCNSIHRAIMNRSYIEIYRTVAKIGVKPVGIKTDCLIFKRDGISEAASDIMREMCVRRDFPMKFEKVKKCKEISMVLGEPEVFEQRDIKHAKETDYESIDALTDDVLADIRDRRCVRIEGVAGSGKSTMIRKITGVFRDEGFEVVNVAPDWVAAANINGSTLHTQFKLGFKADGWFNRTKNLKLEKTVVIIDEVSKLDRNLLAFAQWIRNNAYALVVMGDCEHQCTPVQRSYISVSSALSSFVDCEYKLEICKRGADILKPALELFEGGSAASAGYNILGYNDVGDLCDKYIAGGFERVITKCNATRIAINTTITEKLAEGKQCVDIKLSTSSTVKDVKEIDTKLFPGLKMVCIKNNKKLGLIKSDIVVVSSVSPLMVHKLCSDGTTKVIFYNDGEMSSEALSKLFSGSFDLGYAITCYKSQSATYRFKYIIMGLDSMAKREKFVATTRADELANIYMAELI